MLTTLAASMHKLDKREVSALGEPGSRGRTAQAWEGACAAALRARRRGGRR